MRNTKCECGGFIYLNHIDNLYRLFCPKCGKYTAWYREEKKAQDEWNERTKSEEE